jgi:signal transduction histidine kinase/ligand-binding sensor domain-containing protein
MDRFSRSSSRIPGLLLGALVALQAEAVYALDPARLITQYSLDVWLTRDGLPQNSVRAVVQTRDGYLWLGTGGGLVRFDGVRFTVFDHANTPALGDNRITALAEGPDGSLWIGTAQAGLVRLKDGVFQAFRSEQDSSYEERSRWQIRSIALSRQGGVWIGTSGGGFRRFKDDRFSRLFLDRHVVGAIIEDSSGHLWVDTRDAVLELSWTEPDTFQVVRRLAGTPVNAIYEDRRGTIWIGGRQGLTRLSGNPVTTFTRREGFPADVVLSICDDHDGNLWIGTSQGLVRMRGEQFDLLTVNDGLANGFIASLHEDREGSLWMGSLDGLHRLRDTRFIAVTAREGLSANVINSVLAARDGTIWIATEGGGLNRLRGGRVTAYTSADGLPGNHVGALFEASDGTLWISGDGVVTQLQRERFRVYRSSDGVPHGFVSAIGETRDGRIVMRGEGPARVLENDRFVVFEPQPSRMEYCYSIARDRGGHLWFATTGGLGDLDDAGYRLYRTADGLPHEGVHSIHEDASGAMWVATVSGLARLKDGRVTSFSKVGPLGEAVFEILEDDAGNLWMNGRQGILKVAKRDLEAYAAGQRRDVPLTVYGLADGMRSTEYNDAYIQRPASRAPDGRLWFATRQGVVSVDPSADWGNRVPPPLAIESVVIDGRVETERPLEVPPGSSSFEIHYTALSLVAPSRVRFAYQLEGLDPVWIHPGSRRVALYSRVPPGRYRFHLRAANNDGVWNDTAAMLDIRVLPHLYQTQWFRASAAVLFGLALFGLHRMRLRRVEARLLLVMKERNRIARELHDTLAQGLAGIGLQLSAIDQECSAASREQHVKMARRLVKASLADAKRSVWNLRPEYLDRRNLVAGLARLAADLGEGGDVHIDVRTSGIARTLESEVEMNVFRIAQEAVANAIRHGAARQILIDLQFDDDTARLTVADDGRGFDPASQSDGFGLTSMRERAAQIGAVLHIESLPSAGVSVTLTIPLNGAAGGHALGRPAAWARGAAQRISRRWPRRGKLMHVDRRTDRSGPFQS